MRPESMILIFFKKRFLGKKSGASPKSGDIAIGARTALDFNGNSHYVAIFEKMVESQKRVKLTLIRSGR